MDAEANKFEKWMRLAFDTKNASGAWENAQRFFGAYGVSTAQAQTLQSRFMTACHNSDNPSAVAAFETLIKKCKADHGNVQVFYLSDDDMPTSNTYSKAQAAPQIDGA